MTDKRIEEMMMDEFMNMVMAEEAIREEEAVFALFDEMPADATWEWLG